MKPVHLLGAGLLGLMAATAQAQLAVGTVAIYSDGDVEKLIAYENSHPVWEDVRKRRYTLANNPVIPLLKYENLLSPSSGYRVSITYGNPDKLTGAQIGQQTPFKLRRQYQDGSGSNRQWVCEVESPAQFQLDNRTYPVNRYKCQRFTPHKKMSYPVLRETRLISHSPELGLNMQLNSETRDGSNSRKLEYLLPPADASAQNIARFHRKIILRNN